MAYDIALGRQSHDLVFGDDMDLILIDNAERVAQQAGITLQFWLGEWFLDETLGVPYLEDILVKTPDRSTIESVFRAALADVPDLSAVNSLALQIDRQQRSLTVTFGAETGFGVVNRSIVLDA